MRSTQRDKHTPPKKLILLLLLSWAIALAYGRDLYVDLNHPSSQDSNPGTEELPWATIRNAAIKATAGDVVYIKGGIYYESSTIWIESSGTASQPIIFRNYGSDQVIVDGSLMASGSIILRWRYPGQNYITLQGLEFRNAKDAAIWVEGDHNLITRCKVYNTNSTGILCRKGKYNEYRYLEIHHTGWNGIDLEDSEYSTIEWCDIHDCSQHHAVNVFPAPGGSPWYGMMSGNAVRHTRMYRCNKGMYLRYVADMEISNNLIYDNLEYGIFFHYQSEHPTSYDAHTRIYNNTIVGNNWEGIWDQNANYLTIENNIFCNDKDRELWFGAITGHTIDYNLYDPGTGTLIYWDGPSYTFSGFKSSGFEAHGLAGNTAFVNDSAENYQLTSSSSAIDRGINLAAAGIRDDLAGGTRPQGAGYDIGCYEYGVSSGATRPAPPQNLRVIP